MGKIAEKDAQWNRTDVLNGLSQSRLVTACKISENHWQVVCEIGGYAPSYKIVEIHKKGAKNWSVPKVTQSLSNPNIDCLSLK